MAITGGAGFIGANLADRLLGAGERVLLLDDLSRAGSARNLAWLARRHGDALDFRRGDVRDRKLVDDLVADAGFVYHFAAQVAVTTSLERPLEDSAVNIGGTLNLLEAIRASRHRPGLLFASTNKVYGALDDIPLGCTSGRWLPADRTLRARGIAEDRPLRFISPYGCSKGAADQYVLDYGRSYGLVTLVFRMSCIYGPHQNASGDQGWVTHFLRCVLEGEPLTLYGDGQQVRDILYIDDFVDALLAARAQAPALAGLPFNVGGGPEQALSLLELVDLAASLTGRRPPVSYAEARVGDQRYFAADHGRLTERTGWRPRIPPETGVQRVLRWLGEEAGRADPVPEPGVRWA